MAERRAFAIGVVVAVASACGIQRAPTPSAVVGNQSKPYGSDGSFATRDALITATLSALASHDVDALVRLADIDAFTAKALTCRGGINVDRRAEADRDRKQAVELVAQLGRKTIEQVGIIGEHGAFVYEKAKPLGGAYPSAPTECPDEPRPCPCAVKTTYVHHDLVVKVEVNGSRPTRYAIRVHILAFELNGAWYLAGVPDFAELADVDNTNVREWKDSPGATSP